MNDGSREGDRPMNEGTEIEETFPHATAPAAATPTGSSTPWSNGLEPPAPESVILEREREQKQQHKRLESEQQPAKMRLDEEQRMAQRLLESERRAEQVRAQLDDTLERRRLEEEARFEQWRREQEQRLTQALEQRRMDED